MSVVWVYNAQEAASAVQESLADGSAFALRGRGTKTPLGRPVSAERTLDLSRIAGAIRYEPEELILTVKAGTPLSDIEGMLREKRQMLPFEPPDWGHFFGASERRGTIGGVLGADLCGPRAFKAGRPRDALLGFTAVNGFGEAYKAGGKVVKNVTGYDLPKLMCGAFGTLGPLIEVTLKVLPAPEREDTIVLRGMTAPEGLRLLRGVAGEPLEATGLAHLSGELARHLEGVLGVAEGLTAVRFEGAREAVEERVALVMERYRRAGARKLGGDVSHDLWKRIGNLDLLSRESGVVWRITAPPFAAPAIAGEIGPNAAQYDWAGGLMWLVLDDAPHAHANLVRQVAARHGAQATLFRASEASRATHGVFQPLEPALERLNREVKAAFDPKAVFNPGRMYEGI
jgi:glycolate oxidase FAD binding subunit